MERIMVVTGGTGGIGYYTAVGLARTGARVVVTGRDTERGAQAVERIKQESGSQAIEFARGDLATLEGVRALADDLSERFERIDVLVNNAGSLTMEREVNEDGFERNFAINVVAPYVLTTSLRPLLERSTDARVFILTGGSPAGKIDIENIQAEKSFVSMASYTNSKRAAEAMAMSMAKELESSGVGVHVVYPGAASTAMSAAVEPSAFPWYMRPLFPVFRLIMQRDDGGKSAEKASRSSVWSATAEELMGQTGKYVDTNSKIARLHASVYDESNQARVMDTVRAGLTN